MILSRYERMIAKRYLLPGKGEGFIFLVAGISLVAVMLGVAALIIVMSVMNGFRAELFDKIVGLNGHAVVQGYGGRLPDWQNSHPAFADAEEYLPTPQPWHASESLGAKLPGPQAVQLPQFAAPLANFPVPHGLHAVAALSETRQTDPGCCEGWRRAGLLQSDGSAQPCCASTARPAWSAADRWRWRSSAPATGTPPLRRGNHIC